MFSHPKAHNLVKTYVICVHHIQNIIYCLKRQYFCEKVSWTIDKTLNNINRSLRQNMIVYLLNNRDYLKGSDQKHRIHFVSLTS